MQIGTSVYMMTQRGMMPGTLVGFGGERGDLYNVASPGGAVYTTRPENVFGVEAAQEILLQQRVEKMQNEGYVVAPFAAGAFHVYQPKKHKNTSGYIVTTLHSGYMTCTCPSFAKNFEAGNCRCKHTELVTLTQAQREAQIVA